MVAYIKRVAVGQQKWLSESDFSHGIAICNSIPGATAMQMAAYVGLRAGGGLGAVAAYMGFGLPAFLLMVALSEAYLRSGDVAAVISIFAGLKVVVVAIVANAAVTFGSSILKRWQDWLLASFAGVFIASQGTPVEAILASAIAGIFLYRHMLPAQSAPRDDIENGRGVRAYWAIAAALLAWLAILFTMDRDLFQLSLLMAKVDLFAFGGGYASLPLMFHEVVSARQWMDGKTFMDGIALGQVTPGPIVITATFVGYLRNGLAGALAGTIGILTPSLVILIASVPHFDRLQHHYLFKRALKGILAAFVGLLAAVAIRFGMTVEWNIMKMALVGLAFGALLRGVEMLWVVLAGGIISWLLF